MALLVNVSLRLLHIWAWDVSFVQTGIPYPFNETIDSAAYLGFEKLDNGRILADYIKVMQ